MKKGLFGKISKKVSAVVLAGAMAVSMVGCGGGNATQGGSAPADSNTASNSSADTGSAPAVEGKNVRSVSHSIQTLALQWTPQRLIWNPSQTR